MRVIHVESVRGTSINTWQVLDVLNVEYTVTAKNLATLSVTALLLNADNSNTRAAALLIIKSFTLNTYYNTTYILISSLDLVSYL